MEVTGKKGLGDIIKTFLQICFYLGIIILVVLPFLLQKFGLNISNSALIIYPNGIILLSIDHKFIELFDSLKNNNPFCEDNVKRLRRTGIITFLGAWIWIVDLLYQIVFVNSFNIIIVLVTVFLFILYIGVSIALYILSELFKQATEYKKENELTI